jgi:predicted DNA-binding ribbon-helix-helix protein
MRDTPPRGASQTGAIVIVSARVERATYLRLREVAAAQGRSVSGLLREVVERIAPPRDE